VRSIFAQPDAVAVHAQFTRVIEQLAERFPAAAEMLDGAGPDILAFIEVVGIFPDRGAVIRCGGGSPCSIAPAGCWTRSGASEAAGR